MFIDYDEDCLGKVDGGVYPDRQSQCRNYYLCQVNSSTESASNNNNSVLLGCLVSFCFLSCVLVVYRREALRSGPYRVCLYTKPRNVTV